MSNDGLSELYGLLYIFSDPIAIKDPFSGGNVGQKQWKLTIFAFFVYKLWFLWERIMSTDGLSDLYDILCIFRNFIAI